MLVKPVSNAEDFNQVFRWLALRGAPLPERSLFPTTGFIIDGIAAGFIYITNSPVAILDCFISNPESDSKTRSDALDLITQALVDVAKIHQCKLIKCDTQIEAIKIRAEKHGFKPLGSYESFLLKI